MMTHLRGICIALLLLSGSVLKAQNDCAAYPKTGKFDTLTYIKASVPTDPGKGSGIWLGQGTILRNGSEVRPAFIPSNHPEWAIAIAVAWNYSRNIVNRVEYPQIGYWLATVVQETELACVTGTTWSTPAQTSNNMANATTIMNHDGCFQIEGPGSAYGQLNQNYPMGRFPASLHPTLIMGPTNFETSAMVKSYFDVYTTSVYNNYVGWDVYESIDCTTDPYAYIKTSASGYNGGINAFAGNAGKFNGSMDNNSCWGGFTATTANYANDVAKWVSVLENTPSYCEYPTGSSFDSYYNGDMTWTMVNNYINSIKVMYPEVNWTTVTAAVQAKFNSLATGGKIKFQQMGDVIDAIVINLPKDYPQTVEGSPIGVNVFGCSGNKVPYGHFEILNGAQTVCLGESVTMNIVVDAGGGAAPTFKWYKSSAPGTILATTQSYTITPTAVGSVVYSAEVCNSAGCYRLNSNECNACMDSRNLCGVQINAKQCSNCTFTAAATSTNTPCKGIPGGKINLTLTNTPANYTVSYTGTTSTGNVSGSFASTGNTVQIEQLRDGSYNIQLVDANDPTCKASTTVIVGYTTNVNYYLDANITGVANCVAGVKAEVKELPAPCNWKVRVHVPTYFMWENPVNFGVTTSTGLTNVDRYTRTAAKPEIDQWNDAQIYESVFSLNTGDVMTFKFGMTNTPGATMWRDYQITVFDENNNQVYSKLVAAQSAKVDQPYTAGSYTVTCPATIPNYTFSWSPSLTAVVNTNTKSTGTAPVDKTTDKTYTVTAINSNAPQCSLTDTVIVRKNPACTTVSCTKPSATISGGGAICPGDSIPLTVTLTGSANWKLRIKNGSIITKVQNITASPYTFFAKTTGTYSIDTVWDANCDTLGKGTVVVTLKATPTATITGAATICQGDSTQMSVALTGAANWKLKINAGGTISTVSGISGNPYKFWAKTGGTYKIDSVWDANCRAKGIDTALVVVNPQPTITTAGNTTICQGDTAKITLTLTGTAPYTIKAGIGAVTVTYTAAANSYVVPITTPGTYTIDATDSKGCKAQTKSVTIVVNPKVTVAFAKDTINICAGTPVNLSPVVTGGTPAFTYVWAGLGSGSATSFSANAQGYYYVGVTDSKSCAGKDTVYVKVSSNLTVNLQNKTICTGDSLILDAGYDVTNYHLQWNTGDTTQTIKVKIAGIYGVVLQTSAGGCQGSDSMTLALYAIPTLSLGADDSICAGTTATLDAGAGFSSYLWSTSETSRTIAKGQGTYNVTATDANGCKARDTIQITEIAKPVPNVIQDIQTCSGSNVPFDESSFNNGNGAYTYKWSDNSTAAAYTLNNVTAPTTVWVDVTDRFGCTGRDSAKVTISSALPVQISGQPDTMLCAGGAPITLSSQYTTAGGYTFAWSGAATGTNETITVGTAGQVTLLVSKGGCNGTDKVTVVVNALPDITLVPTAKSICSGEAASLGYDYGANHTYLWENSAPSTVSANAIYNTFSGDTYNVTVTNTLTGCKADTTVIVTAHSKPTVGVGNDVDTCNNVTITLSETTNQAGVTYAWRKGNSATVVATTLTYSISSSDKYKLTVTDAFGCFAADSMNAVFRVMPVVNLLGSDTSTVKIICEGETLSLDATNNDPGMTYLWSTLATGPVLNVSQTGSYSVTVTNGKCVAKDTQIVAQVVLPKLVLNDSVNPLTSSVYCFAEETSPVVLSAMTNDPMSAFYNYLWSTGETTPQITIAAGGIYSVKVGLDKCSVSDVIGVTDFCPTTFFVPNSFTPNSDNRNDVFRVEGLYMNDFELLIFDRWGQLIYKSNDPSAGWDGTVNGKAVQQDVYVWKVNYKINMDTGKKQAKEKIGHVTVIY
ncbi:MAG: T9SS type B sorting domain-containing protein [Flavobacteriales bacterium]